MSSEQHFELATTILELRSLTSESRTPPGIATALGVAYLNGETINRPHGRVYLPHQARRRLRYRS